MTMIEVVKQVKVVGHEDGNGKEDEGEMMRRRGCRW